MLGSLALLGHGLDQAIGQLARGLERSADYYDLYEADPGRTPDESIEEALRWLASATQHARMLGYALGNAQNAIAGQGWHGDPYDQGEADQDGADR